MNDEMIYDETVEMPEKKTRFIAKHKNALIVALISLVLVGCLLFATFAYIVPEVKYYGALDDIENGNYKEAYITLKTLGNYKDSEKLLDDFKLIYLREEKLQYDEYEDLVRTEKIELNELGETRLKVRYDENGELWYKEEYDENGKERCYIFYENYDGEKRLVSQREYNENGDITLEWKQIIGIGIYKHEYEYDPYGRLATSTEYIEEQNTETTTNYRYEYKYFNGKLYSVLANGEELFTYDNEGRLKSASTVKYGKIQSRTEYDENGNITLELKYDSFGSVSSKTAWENGKKTLAEKYKSGTMQRRTLWENGNEILEEEYSNGILVKKIVWQYNEKGQTSLREAYVINATKTGLILSAKTEYNANGKATININYDLDGKVKNRREKTYDANGNMTLSVSYDGNGEVLGTTEYAYDDHGNEILMAQYDRNGNVYYKTEKKFDDDSRLIYKISHDENGDISEKKDFTFDSDGNIIAYTGYFGGEAPYTDRNVLEYDDEGRNTLNEVYKRRGDGEEILTEKEVTEYDKYGNVVYESKYVNYRQYGTDGEETTEYEYVLEYDEDGIVIKKTTYINGVMRYETTYTDPIVLYQPKGE